MTVWANAAKSSTTFTTAQPSDLANLWASTVQPFQLTLPWQHDTPVRDTVYTNSPKH
jgi:hypothetical protein